MDKAEKVRTATESRLVTVQRELSVCKEQSDKYLAQRDKLATELRASRDKMKTQEGELMMSRGEAAKYLAGLKDVLYRVQPLAAPPKIEAPKPEPIKENGVEKAEAKEEKEEQEEEAIKEDETDAKEGVEDQPAAVEEKMDTTEEVAADA